MVGLGNALLIVFVAVHQPRAGGVWWGRHQIAVRFRKRIASFMAIGSEVFGSCVEGIRVEVRQQNDEALFVLS